MKYLIVGVDPGHTIGLAAVDFEGNIVYATHLLNEGIEGAVSAIEKWGTPSLIACDVRPAPESVLKIASYFNVRLFAPGRVWTEEEKKALIKKIGLRYENEKIAQNAHERDAISAAIGAWREEQNLLRSARVAGVGGQKKDELRHLLLQGYRMNIALEMMEPKKETGSGEIAEGEGGSERQKTKTISDLHLKIRELEKTNVELRKFVQIVEQQKELLLHKIKIHENGAWKEAMKDNEFRKMRARILKLEERVAYYTRILYQMSKRRGWREKEGGKNEKAQGKEWGENKKSARLEPVREKNDLASDLKELDTMDSLEQLVSEYRKSRSGKE